MNLQLSNPFAALEVRKTRKKKPGETDKKKHGGTKHQRNLRLEEEIFGKAQSNVSNWADADDDDWAADHSAEDPSPEESNGREPIHESEEEIDMEEHFGVELGPEEEHEDHEKPTNSEEPTEEELTLLEEHRKKYQAQPQRTLSKKELKKKEMEDFDNMLAGFGIDIKSEEKQSESSSKRKKKKNKDKSITEESQIQHEKEASESDETEIKISTDQIKPRIEKASKSLKKRTTSKKSVEIAAAEAKARNKGKKGKKDSSHYNQAPNH